MDLTWNGIAGYFADLPTRSDDPNLDRFLSDRDVTRLIETTTRRNANRLGVGLRSQWDDFANEARVVAFLILTNDTWLTRARKYQDFPRGFYFLVFARFRQVTESSEYLGSRGMSPAMRRYRALHRHRAKMTEELGHEPSPDQVVSSYNALVTETRKNVVKQAALASLDDFRPLTPGSLDELFEANAAPALAGNEMVLTPTAHFLMDEVRRRCADYGPPLTDLVVDTLLSGADEGFFVPVAQAASDLGIEERILADCRTALQAIAIQVFSDYGMPTE